MSGTILRRRDRTARPPRVEHYSSAVHKLPRMIVLDMDSSVSPTHGDQEGTAYNGHFGCTCYHPLFVFNQFGDLERCGLRPGNVHSAHEWRDVLEPVVARYRNRTLRRYFRGDAAFASPEVYEFLEAEDFSYAIRLPANKVLQGSIAHLLKRPVGRPPNDVRRYHAGFSYQAASWDKPRRVVAKVEWHPGELYPRVGFIVTNLSRPTERVVALQSARHGRAMDQGRQKRHQVDTPVVEDASFPSQRRGSNSTRSPTISAYFMEHSCCPAQWSLTTLRENQDRRRSSATVATSSSRWPRSLSLVTCSPTSSAESIGSERRPSQHDDRIVPHA